VSQAERLALKGAHALAPTSIGGNDSAALRHWSQWSLPEGTLFLKGRKLEKLCA
jgi:hypothetical protein